MTPLTETSVLILQHLVPDVWKKAEKCWRKKDPRAQHLANLVFLLSLSYKTHLEVTLTFWWCAHNSRLVSMATVSGDKGPAPAITQPVFITAATQALIVEESGAGAELGAPQR